jgi:hypothetical protein
MPTRKKLPVGAIPRQCTCGKRFGPMTDKQWDWSRRIHLVTSMKHNPQ